jgi:hypothetical protein
VTRIAASRACLHCALARALSTEADAYASRGLELRLTRSEPVWLPVRGATIYRGIVRLLQRARDEAAGGSVRLAVLSLPGKTHVEVTAVVASERGHRVLACAFPQFVAARLAGGFSEHAGS